MLSPVYLAMDRAISNRRTFPAVPRTLVLFEGSRYAYGEAGPV